MPVGRMPVGRTPVVHNQLVFEFQMSCLVILDGKIPPWNNLITFVAVHMAQTIYNSSYDSPVSFIGLEFCSHYNPGVFRAHKMHSVW